MITALTAAIALAYQTSGASAPELTIYNQGIALIKQSRSFQLKAGIQSIAIEDVSAMIDSSSVGFRSRAQNPFSVLEQNYQYDLIGAQAILNKSVGQRVRFVRTLGQQRDVLEGTLLSAPTAIVSNNGTSQQTYNGMVIRTDDGRVVLDPTGEVEVQRIPEGLISRPTLQWLVDVPVAGQYPVDLSYISNGFGWNADYVLTLDGLGTADLQGWVTINNQSGTRFENAKLKLLAGDIHQAAPQATTRRAMAFGATMSKSDSSFQEESLFEYHLYTLQRPTTLANRESKQISLLEGHDVPVRKRLIVDSMMGIGSYYPSEGLIGVGDVSPQVRIEFTNDQASHLGMPLPKGRLRVFQRDKSGSVQMLGEDNINHTPKNEKLSVVVGRSFDVVSTRKRTSFTRISSQAVSESFEIEVRNRKESAETVEVLERHWGDWKVTTKNSDFTKEDANTMLFRVTLKPNEVRKVTYTVETRW